MYGAGYLYFVAARVIGMAQKPLMIFYFLDRDMLNSASLISLVFLSLSSLLVLFSVPFHIDFYQKIFSDGATFVSARRLLKKYE